MDDVIVNKVAIVTRCLARIAEVYAAGGPGFRTDLTRQDSVILNLQRAVEATIDLAMVLVRRRRLGVPQSSRDAFRLLAEAGAITEGDATALQRMVGFRNIAVHDYQRLNMAVVEAVLDERLGDLRSFTEVALRELDGSA